MKKIVIIAAVVVVVIIICFVAAFFLFFRGDAEPKEPVLTYYSTGEYYVTNVKDSNKLFKVSVDLGLDNEKLIETLSANNVVIRDEIIFILRELTEEKINSPNIKEELSTQIRDRLNEIFKTESIHEIKYVDFVMQ